MTNSPTRTNLDADPRVRYALGVLLGTEAAAGAPIFYGDAPKGDCNRPAIHILPSKFFAEHYGTPDSLPPLPLTRIDGVPLLFGRPEVCRRGNRLMVHADIVASAYFMVTRYEEWIRRDARDEHGRFPGRESLPVRAGFIDTPIVDEYALLLRKWAKEMQIPLPEPQRQFSLLLTHDVDTLGIRPRLFQACRSLAGVMVGRRRPATALANAAIALGLVRDPCDNLDRVIQLSRTLFRLGAGRCRLVAFFLAGGNSPLDGNYDIRWSRARKAIQQVLARGGSVGLHASYDAGQHPDRLKREREVLEEIVGMPVHKSRHHYLGWREVEDGHSMAEAGINWDSTMGYADTAGFRLGVCRPIPLFDPAGRCPLGIEEHPLVVMDNSLSKDRYMNLSEEEAFAYVCKLADATYRHQGEFVTLWHSHVLASSDTSYHRRLYVRVLEYLTHLLTRTR